MSPLFTYGALADGATYHDVVGRHPHGVPALLPGYRVQHSLGYAYVVEEEGSLVEGFLVQNVQTPDLWILDDYHSTSEGLYERRKVQVQVEDQFTEATTYVGGPGLASP